jgi:hypothetical protein
LNDLLLSINNTVLFDPALAGKLRSILDTAASAAGNKCNTLFLGAADAIADEMLGLLFGQPASVLQQYNPVIEDLLQYVATALDSIKTNTPPATNAPPCCSVMLVRKHGSTAQAKLFDAKRKINADVGEVVSLDVVTCPPNGAVKWDYKFTGQAKGAVPSGAGAASRKTGSVCSRKDQRLSRSRLPSIVRMERKRKTPSRSPFSDSSDFSAADQ